MKIIEKFNELNKFTKYLIYLYLVFMGYGIISRIVPIYYFWESFSIGWIIFFIIIIMVFISEIKKRKKINKKNTLNKIGIGIICFILFVKGLLLVIIPNTDAYKAAKEYLKTDIELKKELGGINGFGLLSNGGISTQSSSEGNSGNAELNIIIKGTKKYKIVNIILYKERNTEWEVYNIN